MEATTERPLPIRMLLEDLTRQIHGQVGITIQPFPPPPLRSRMRGSLSLLRGGGGCWAPQHLHLWEQTSLCNQTPEAEPSLPTCSTRLREEQGAVHPALPLTSPAGEGPALPLGTSTGGRESRQVKLVEPLSREEIARNGTEEPPPPPQPAHSWKHPLVVVLLIYTSLPSTGLGFWESRPPCIQQPPPQRHAPHRPPSTCEHEHPPSWGVSGGRN